MDIVAIILIIKKKYKEALIVSGIGLGLVLILLLANIVESQLAIFSIIVYIVLLIISGVKLSNKEEPVKTKTLVSLEEIQSLRAKGIITEEEYESKRAEIINKD